MGNSKEETILELFFNESSKHWHFEEILRTAKVSRSKAFKWLKKLVNEGIIRHIKPQHKMPYYQAIFESPAYRNKKRVYSLNTLYETGFLNHLQTLPKAKVIIVFGSFSRSDWHTGSDIDVFIYGSGDGLDQHTYEHALGREIQVFVAENQKDLNKFAGGLLQNIINGYRVKGDLEELIPVHAAI